MENFKDKVDRLVGEYIKELEEENKKLKKKIELLDNENMCLNAEIKDREEENKKLKSDLAFERTMLDNVRAEYKSLQNVIKKLKERIEALELCIDVD